MAHGTNILFDNTYARLPERFFARQAPAPVPAPTLVRINRELAATLSVDSDWFASADGVAMLAGSATPEGSEPIAQAYAGHQFRGFVPHLGDGRAILLGEAIDTSGARRDLQLKGSGRTPFSRGGDGRAALGPVLREYVISEAMSALGVPTTRALAAVTTGEIVMRQEGPLAGGVFTRVAASHIRVGTFQYFLVRNDIEWHRQRPWSLVGQSSPGKCSSDDLVVSFDGETTLGSQPCFTRALTSRRPGDRVFVKFLRRGTPTTAVVVLEEDPRLELLPVEPVGERLTDDQRAFRAAWLGSKVRN